MKCRHCAAPLELPFIDLGASPPSNDYLSAEQLRGPERWYPLRVLVCTHCWLLQTEDYAGADQLFSADYAYFSSISSSWLEHARGYVETMVERFSLSAESQVVEVASNDGYLLQYVRDAAIPCYGIEPTAGTAAAARAKGIEVVEAFFDRALGVRLAAERGGVDLMAANNVLAHVPDINGFVGGFVELLKPTGVATFEFPHLLRLVEQVQFDTIYHEHYSYLSLTAVQTLFAANGLEVFDVERIPTHGGSLRVFAQRAEEPTREVTGAVAALLAEEARAGMTRAAFYQGFQRRADEVKNAFVAYLIEARRQGLSVAAYGAAAKGNTLLNYAGVRADLLPYVVDRNPAKQGKFLPGSRIPIVGEERLRETRPDRVVILPWNLSREIGEQLAYIGEWGGRFVSAIPSLREWGAE